MSLNLAFFTLLVLLSIYFIIIEIYTIFFMLTGLSHTRSIFQVISLLTNSGFTTSESEIIVSSRRRRRLAILIMITGNLFNVVVVSVLVNMIITLYRDPFFNFSQALIGLGLFLLVATLYKRLPFIRARFDKLIKQIANKWMYSKKSNPLLVLDNFSGYCIVEVKIIEMPKVLQDKTIFESRLSNDFGIRVLFIKRGDHYIGDIDDSQVVLLMDRIIIFGPLHNINKIFNPKYNKDGSKNKHHHTT